MPRIAELIKNGSDLQRFKKSDIDIIDLLMEDTKKGRLHWFGEDDMIYTNVVEKYGETAVDTIFKISDQLIEDEYENEMFGYEFQDMFSNVITLDIYMRKNNKKEIFCRRISTGQLKLSNLLEIILPNLEKKQDKK